MDARERERLANLLAEGRQIAGQILSDSLGAHYVDGYGLLKPRRSYEDGETLTRITGHLGVSGVAGEVGTIGEQGAYRWFETPEGIKRFRLKGPQR